MEKQLKYSKNKQNLKKKTDSPLRKDIKEYLEWVGGNAIGAETELWSQLQIEKKMMYFLQERHPT